MNLYQRIILGVCLGFSLASLALWGITGFDLLTKTKIPVEVIDPLFGTKSIEWQESFVFGLDLAGPIALVAILLGAILLYLVRTK